MASAHSTSANDLMSLLLSIELSILFCDWTVYFYFFNLSRAVYVFLTSGKTAFQRAKMASLSLCKSACGT
jgi:cbb3-type cytochrome oxidase subunit 3